MKVAIVITGEYRTFSSCRATMIFLNDLENDVYVSIWKNSKLFDPLLNIDINEDITIEKVNADIKRPATIEIEDFNECAVLENTNNNVVKMTYRWHRGLELVKASGIEYDFICILRPDMIFNGAIKRLSLKQASEQWDKNIVYCDSSVGVDGVINLNDFLIIATPSIMYSIIDGSTGKNYVNDGVTANWHNWWYKHIIKKGYTINNAPSDMGNSTLGRPHPNGVYNFDLAVQYYQMWFHSQIVTYIDTHGIEAAERNWDKNLINQAIAEVNSRIYTK